MASNGMSLADADGDFEDWIELYNGGQETINLEGYFLSDDEDEPLKWQFPSVNLAPGEHLLIWASGKDRTQGELHTNFRISIDGEPIILTAPNGRTVVDRIEATYIPRDMSYGRLDGELVYFLIPSPGEANDISRDNTLPQGYFDVDEPREISFAWVAIIVLALLFAPLFIIFWLKTRR